MDIVETWKGKLKEPLAEIPHSLIEATIETIQSLREQLAASEKRMEVVGIVKHLCEKTQKEYRNSTNEFNKGQENLATIILAILKTLEEE